MFVFVVYSTVVWMKDSVAPKLLTLSYLPMDCNIFGTVNVEPQFGVPTD